MVTLKFIGDHEREFPGIGVFKPGEKRIFPFDNTAAVLLASGYFIREEGDE